MDQIFQIKPTLITCWPMHLDFPLWRQQIHNNRNKFDQVIIVFTNHNVGGDYRSFVREAMKMDSIKFMDNRAVGGEEDWRDIATNLAINKSSGEWILFTEEDFFWKDGFWDLIYKNSRNYECIHVSVQGRMHPCGILIKRSLLKKTCRDFSPIRDVSDHFSRIQNDLEKFNKLEVPQELWYHLGGLSQNMHLMMNGQKVEYYPDEFIQYAKDCLSVTVPMHKDFRLLFENYLWSI